jgi:hypothetical protein
LVSARHNSGRPFGIIIIGGKDHLQSLTEAFGEIGIHLQVIPAPR